MKKKDIGILIVAVLVIVFAGYYAFVMIFPPQKNAVPDTTVATKTQITGQIDETTLGNISKLKDYGEASLDNIGRVNPFAPIK